MTNKQYDELNEFLKTIQDIDKTLLDNDKVLEKIKKILNVLDTDKFKISYSNLDQLIMKDQKENLNYKVDLNPPFDKTHGVDKINHTMSELTDIVYENISGINTYLTL